ncbi:MAG: hypothetical protein IT342_22890 [Candidatus Melainabacteria bacterium]|nr:hypothetical protein [Candidatus Melainabacteria bacterium]
MLLLELTTGNGSDTFWEEGGASSKDGALPFKSMNSGEFGDPAKNPDLNVSHKAQVNLTQKEWSRNHQSK